MSEEQTKYTTQQSTAAEYHALPGVSHSRLKVAMSDIRQYDYQFRSGLYVPERKDYFDFGTCVHDVALRGIDSAVLIPDGVLSSSGSKAGNAWKAFAAEHDGEILLKQAEYDRVLRCVEALYADPAAGELLRGSGISEDVHQHYDEDLGLTLRCMVDRLSVSRAIALDIKTTEQASTAGQFAKTAASYGYHTQEYFYRRVLRACGIEVDSFIFIAVRTKPAHTVDCYTLSAEFLKLAETAVENALQDLAERERSGDWTSRTAGKVVEIEPPGWLKYAGDYVVE